MFLIVSLVVVDCRVVIGGYILKILFFLICEIFVFFFGDILIKFCIVNNCRVFLIGVLLMLSVFVNLLLLIFFLGVRMFFMIYFWICFNVIVLVVCLIGFGVFDGIGIKVLFLNIGLFF